MSLAPLKYPATLPRKRLFTADEYHRMGVAGVFGAGERTELIEGEIVHVTPMGSSHAAAVIRLIRLFSSASAGRFSVSSQTPTQLGTRNEPEPDVMLVKPRKDDYEFALPKAEDVLLIVEVSDSTLVFDRQVKVPMYARQGIPEVWLVDLTKQQLEVYLKPSAAGYAQVKVATKDDTVAPQKIRTLKLSVADIFAKRSSRKP